MFQPNSSCLLRRKVGRDKHGQEKLGDQVEIGYAPVDLARITEKTSVRSDSSASRGQADQITSTAKILIPTAFPVQMDDQFEIDGNLYRVSGVHARKSVFGVLDHYEVDLEAWPA